MKFNDMMTVLCPRVRIFLKLAFLLCLGTASKVLAQDQTIAEVTKDYRYANVCFEKDSDGDGSFEVTGTDPEDCPEGTLAGSLLPNADRIYFVEPVVDKKGIVKSYKPGQYYAVSTVTLTSDVPELDISEIFIRCTSGAHPLSKLNPPRGGGNVVVVIEDESGKLLQILDGKDEQVSIENGVATVHLTDADVNLVEGTKIWLYVKFGPGLKKQELPEDHLTCVNGTSVSVDSSNAIRSNAIAILSLEPPGSGPGVGAATCPCFQYLPPVWACDHFIGYALGCFPAFDCTSSGGVKLELRWNTCENPDLPTTYSCQVTGITQPTPIIPITREEFDVCKERFPTLPPTPQ